MQSITLDWHDEFNRDSYKLCLEPYGLVCMSAIDRDPDTVEITLYGTEEDIEAFSEDYDDDSLIPLDQMSSSLEFDEDYEGWLNNEVYWYDQAHLDVFKNAIVVPSAKIETDHA